MLEALLQAALGPLGGILAGLGAVVAALALGRWQGASKAKQDAITKDRANADKIRDKADRARRADDAGVNNGTAGYLQAVLLQILIYQVEQLITQVVLLHQVAELADRGFVRHRLPTEVDADEVAQRTRVVESFLGGRIRQVEPVLDEVDSQHRLDTDWAPTGALSLGIERFDSGGLFLPGNDGFHLFQELLFASLLPVFLESGIGKGVLAHEVQLILGTGSIINEHRN
jgi:hypothetical protein